jgi:hypothetical protein
MLPLVSLISKYLNYFVSWTQIFKSTYWAALCSTSIATLHSEYNIRNISTTTQTAVPGGANQVTPAPRTALGALKKKWELGVCSCPSPSMVCPNKELRDIPSSEFLLFILLSSRRRSWLFSRLNRNLFNNLCPGARLLRSWLQFRGLLGGERGSETIQIPFCPIQGVFGLL